MGARASRLCPHPALRRRLGAAGRSRLLVGRHALLRAGRGADDRGTPRARAPGRPPQPPTCPRCRAGSRPRRALRAPRRRGQMLGGQPSSVLVGRDHVFHGVPHRRAPIIRDAVVGPGRARIVAVYFGAAGRRWRPTPAQWLCAVMVQRKICGAYLTDYAHRAILCA